MFELSPSVIGKSQGFLKVMKTIPILASSDAPILVLGETGTGKELVAKEIHKYSARVKKDFFPINCGALPNDLFESELFGHAKGAFTDAKIEKPGILQRIDGGTLFLDEIDSLSVSAQGKLLRFLQEGEFRPLGYCQNIKADIRVIAATNANLGERVHGKIFREDLFHRLNVLNINLPPLRERIEDIPLLAEYFVGKFSSKYKKPHISLAPETTLGLLSYDWPGNIRELEGAVERAVLTATSNILHPQDIGVPTPTFADPFPRSPFYEAKNQIIDRFEYAYLRALLRIYKGNVSQASHGAGVDRRILQRLLRKHHIDRLEFLEKSSTFHSPTSASLN